MTISDDTRSERERDGAPTGGRPAGRSSGAPTRHDNRGATGHRGNTPGPVTADATGSTDGVSPEAAGSRPVPQDRPDAAGSRGAAEGGRPAGGGRVGSDRGGPEDARRVEAPVEADHRAGESARAGNARPREPVVDSVGAAADSPDHEQPYIELGLRPDEYERIRRVLGRRPTSSELAMYSIMWSEHCSYKSSKVHLRQFSEKAPPSSALLAGIGENAGVIRISEDLAVTFKIESHNHPSFVEPHQGAATGVGGIVRDILAMGARPVGVMDSLRFGAAEHPDTARVLPGVVDGVGAYGNCLGLPNIGGEVVFDPCYQGNPLVNALCVGVLPADRLQNKAATGPGNVVVLLGAKTGRDGIGGVSVLASATFEDASHARRPSVQVGDPFTEKLLIESCLEMYDLGLVAGIQDLGGAGLTCALSETAAAAGTGMRVWLDQVPLREASMSPEEILASESQERMLLIVEPERMSTVLAVAGKWGVLATPIGRVTEPDADGGRLVVSWRDQVVVDVPPGSLADGPVYARPMREPGDLVLLQADRAETLPRPADGEQMRQTLLGLLASPNLCDRSWVTDQYDRYVLGNTVLAQPEDAGVLRIDERSGLGVALSVDGNGRYTRLDPYRGAQLALAEAYRNVVMTGAQPVAVTNCLNFGSPEDPAVMWQFAEAVRGLADGCAELGIPVTGGNVSFYNQTGAAPVNPTPVVGVLGVLPQVRDRVPMGFRHDGDVLILLGETREELSGSEWAWVVHRHLGGVPPRVDLAAERALGALVTDAASRGQLTAAHDLSDGGLAQALVEGCLRFGHGAKILLPGEVSAFTALFAESTARAVVSVPHGQERGFTALCDEYGVPWTAIGVVTANDPVLEIRDQFTITLDELRQAYESTLPDLFGQPERTDAGTDRPEVDADAAAGWSESDVEADWPESDVDTTGEPAAAGDIAPEVTDQPAAGDIVPEVTDQPAAGDIAPEVTDQPAAGDIAPEVTDQPAAGDRPGAPDAPATDVTGMAPSTPDAGSAPGAASTDPGSASVAADAAGPDAGSAPDAAGPDAGRVPDSSRTPDADAGQASDAPDAGEPDRADSTRPDSEAAEVPGDSPEASAGNESGDTGHATGDEPAAGDGPGDTGDAPVASDKPAPGTESGDAGDAPHATGKKPTARKRTR